MNTTTDFIGMDLPKPVAEVRQRIGHPWFAPKFIRLENDLLVGTKLYTDDQIQAHGQSCVSSAKNEFLQWAVSRWRAEVENRPMINKHRRTLDDTWRQVIRYAGGNPDELIGPSHDALVSASHV